MSEQIGHVTVTKAFDLSRSHESAAQYYTIRVEPGTYPIEVRDSRYGGKYLAVPFGGRVLSAGYGNKRYSELEGTRGQVVMQPYKYELKSGRYWSCDVTLDDPAALHSVGGV